MYGVIHTEQKHTNDNDKHIKYLSQNKFVNRKSRLKIEEICP